MLSRIRNQLKYHSWTLNMLHRIRDMIVSSMTTHFIKIIFNIFFNLAEAKIWQWTYIRHVFVTTQLRNEWYFKKKKKTFVVQTNLIAYERNGSKYVYTNVKSIFSSQLSYFNYFIILETIKSSIVKFKTQKIDIRQIRERIF